MNEKMFYRAEHGSITPTCCG